MASSIYKVLRMFTFVTIGTFLKSSYSPLAPFIRTYFVLNSFQIGLITSIAFVGSTLCSTVSGFFVDNLGHKNSLKLAFGVILVGAVVLVTSYNYTLLIVGYFFMGFGYGLVVPSTNSAIMKEDKRESHGSSMGIKQSGVPAGLILSTIILTVIVLELSLHGAFIFMLIVSATLFLIIPLDRKTKYKKGMTNTYFKTLVSTSKNRTLFFVSGIVLFFSWSQQSLFTFFTLFQESKGFSIILDETFLMILFIGAIAGRLVWGRIGDRKLFKRRKMLLLSIIMLIAGVMLVFLGRLENSVIIMGIFTFFVGMSATGWNSIYIAVISEIAPISKIGVYSGFSLMIMGFGSIFGTPTSGFILDHTSYTVLWSLLGLILISLSILSTIIGRKYFSLLYVNIDNTTETRRF